MKKFLFNHYSYKVSQYSIYLTNAMVKLGFCNGMIFFYTILCLNGKPLCHPYTEILSAD